MTLWMVPGRLREWTGSMAPIVAAIDDPSRPLPQFFKGYYGAQRAVDLPQDGSVTAPVLMVLGQPIVGTRVSQSKSTK